MISNYSRESLALADYYQNNNNNTMYNDVEAAEHRD